VIDTITRIQQALMKFLLVFLVLISVLFLAALPFTGLAPLWETGRGSTLILAMQGLILFFLNAVYQDDPETRPYPLLVHRFIYLGIALLPVYSAIAFYGLWLRVEQYGLTPARCWGFMVWALFALFSLGYCWGIARQRDGWLRHLSWVNVRMGLLVLALMLLVNSPLLDFRQLSVNDQMARLASGELKVDKLDVYHFRYSLGRPGYEALQELKADIGKSHPRVVKEIDRLYASRNPERRQLSQPEFVDSIEMFVHGPIPNPLEISLYYHASRHGWLRFSPGDLFLLEVDLDGNGRNDYVLIQERGNYRYGTVFHWEGDEWKEQSLSGASLVGPRARSLREALKEGSWRVQDQRWKQLEIDGVRHQVNAVPFSPK
jgi:hypothetical protein